MKLLNKTTKIIGIIILLILISIIYFKYTTPIKGWELNNKITLYAVLITIFSTLYSNYKSDERVKIQIETSEKQFKEQLKQNEKNLKKQLKQNEKNLKEQLLFNKKQEIYLKLYNQLNEYWKYLDDERINRYLEKYGEPAEVYISFNTFKELHNIIYNIKFSPEFQYMSNEIKEIINAFISFVDTHLENFEYHEIENDKNYWKAFEILSKLYPLLKTEIILEEDKFLIN